MKAKGLALSIADDGVYHHAGDGSSARTGWRVALEAAATCVDAELSAVQLDVSERVVHIRKFFAVWRGFRVITELRNLKAH